MDLAALHAQVAGCVAHGATTELTWTPPGGAPVTVPATIADEAPEAGTERDRNSGDSTVVLITIARAALAVRTTAVPRQGQILSDAACRYRITADRGRPTHPVLAYLCTVSPRT